MLSTTRRPTRPFRWFNVLLLMSLLAVLGTAQCLAQQAPPTSPATVHATVATVPATASAADFLASLSLDGSGAVPLSGCTSNAQCPPKKLCCLACGFPDCDVHACLTPMNGHCPAIP
jgi:hypothetical protein